MSVSVSDAPAGGVEIKKRSRVPGVMITQYVKELPHGKTTPDFTRKPSAVTVQKGRNAIFRAVVTGEPAPTVRWIRNKGDISAPEKYKTRYDEKSREYILEITNVSAEQADTYKCFATNSFGKATCTASLMVIEAGFKKKKDNSQNDPEDFRKMLKKTTIVKKRKEKPKKEGDIDPKFWEMLLSAQKKDYERICHEFGITDYRWMLKKLNQMKKEREEEQAKVAEKVENTKQIEVKTSGKAEFEFNMKLKDPNSNIYLYKDGEELEYSKGADDSSKYNMNKVGDKYTFCINNTSLHDSGLYQVDVEDTNIFSTDLKIPDVEFDGMLENAKVVEGQDASFECVLSSPVPKITWCANDVSVEHGDKYDIITSEDMLTHRLVVKNCKPEDKGIYAAIAGVKLSKASLSVEDDQNALWRGQSGVDDTNSLPRALDEEQTRVEKGRKSHAESSTAAKVAGMDDDQLFFLKMSDIYAIRGQPAELMCKLNSDKYDGIWSKDGEKLSSKHGMTISRDGDTHKLNIQSCKDSDAGQYQFEVNDCKTDAMLAVGETPQFDDDSLHKFSNPVVVKIGQTASFKMSFPPQPSLDIRWFKGASELTDGGGVKVVKEPNHSRLVIKDCLQSDSGEIKIQLTNVFGTVTALSRLTVLSKPSPPKEPVELIDSMFSVIEFKWNPPKDEGGSKVTNYIIERQQVGQSIWKKLSDVSADHTTFRDKNISQGQRYVYRIYAENSEGISEPLEIGSIMAGSLLFPGPPAPPKVVSAFRNCINLEWAAPEKDGGTKILGYQLEKRKKETNQWIALNPVNEPIKALKYAVKEVSEGSEYEFRVSAINVSGAGEPSGPSTMVCAKNPNMKPHFKDPEDFMVVRAGNSVRIIVNYEASPLPEITWLKDGAPVSPWINIINTESTSMLVIPNSKHSNSGIYTIKAQNSSGQASFNIEVRVSDEPKRPGPVSLEQWVHGKVIITWIPSPDQELDDRLHYMVAEHNSNMRIWRTIADHLFCTTYTTNVHPGQEYHFRVYAKNDMGLSEPSESPTWGVNSNKVSLPTGVSTMITFERPPSVLVPLKVHTPPKGYQCYMTCAVRGCPAPNVSWYLNGICINSNNHYFITNVHGVCSMYIFRVGPDDSGEYKVVAVNSLGKAECSAKLEVQD
ncbi:immunoglobulin-like and fibronectin type III domain-containing protein 1 [Salminus brasiliensis]|uniref:immunoglobulin-like and fibronectin type III domain-containing protein 1 n=1 Tax=Salminus brasiliensis TaxID=930266 RepID=UPI003B830EEC